MVQTAHGTAAGEEHADALIIIACRCRARGGGPTSGARHRGPMSTTTTTITTTTTTTITADEIPQAVLDIGAWRWAVEDMQEVGIHCVDCSTLRALEYMEGVARPDALPTCERCIVAVRLAQQQEVWPRIRGLPREGQAGMEVGMVDSERRDMWEFRENLTRFRQGRLSAAEAPEAVTMVAAAIQSDMCRSPSPPVRDRPRPPAYPPPAHLLRSRSRSRS